MCLLQFIDLACAYPDLPAFFCLSTFLCMKMTIKCKILFCNKHVIYAKKKKNVSVHIIWHGA